MAVNTDTRTLLTVERDGTPVYLCTIDGTEYTGERECPRCQCERLISIDDAEALGLWPNDPEAK